MLRGRTSFPGDPAFPTAAMYLWKGQKTAGRAASRILSCGSSSVCGGRGIRKTPSGNGLTLSNFAYLFHRRAISFSPPAFLMTCSCSFSPRYRGSARIFSPKHGQAVSSFFILRARAARGCERGTAEKMCDLLRGQYARDPRGAKGGTNIPPTIIEDCLQRHHSCTKALGDPHRSGRAPNSGSPSKEDQKNHTYRRLLVQPLARGTLPRELPPVRLYCLTLRTSSLRCGNFGCARRPSDIQSEGADYSETGNFRDRRSPNAARSRARSGIADAAHNRASG